MRYISMSGQGSLVGLLHPLVDVGPIPELLAPVVGLGSSLAPRQVDQAQLAGQLLHAVVVLGLALHPDLQHLCGVRNRMQRVVRVRTAQFDKHWYSLQGLQNSLKSLRTCVVGELCRW